MTKDEIKRELDALGIDYAKDAKLAELEELYAPYVAPEFDQEPDATPNPTGDKAPDATQDGAEAAPAASEVVPEVKEDRRIACVATGEGRDLNVRAEPNLGGRVVCVVGHSDMLEVDGDDVDGWTPVVLHAWAKSEFLA